MILVRSMDENYDYYGGFKVREWLQISPRANPYIGNIGDI